MNNLLLAFLLFGASFIQGAVGFGFALSAMPILVWGGYSLAEASIITALNSLLQMFLAVFQLRRDIPWREVWKAISLRWLFTPLGIWVMMKLDNLPPQQLKQILGLILLVIVLSQLLYRVKPRDKLHPLWGIFAFSSSGFLQGLVSMGGPPLVLWVMALTWDVKSSRAFLMTLFALAVPLHLALLYLSYGQKLQQASYQGLIFIPLSLLGVTLGIRVGNHLPKERLKTLAYGLPHSNCP
ncbi:MAG: sulfite exporter TauE/SafE family protein [Deinococcales bacterium]